MSNGISVEANGLTRRFGKFTAVDGVSFHVHEGEIFGFLGANGAGKTTTIRMLCGLLLPSAGNARVVGYDLYTQAAQIKRSIGYMSQKFSLYEDLTAEENLQFYGGIYGLEGAAFRRACERVLKQTGLEELTGKLTRDLPVGWKQRLALSCAVLHNPKLIFLDEPTGGVDPAARRQFWNLIYGLAEEGTSVFVTTHYMDEAEYCHRLAVMHAGRIIAMGAPQELKKQYAKPSIEQLFIDLVKSEGKAL